MSVLNMKGGVGKTTVAAHVFRVLYREHSRRVLLVDLDPQFNLTQAVLTRKEYDKFKERKKTIYAAMEPSFSTDLLSITPSDAAPPPISALAHKLKQISGKPQVSIDLVPGDFSLTKYSLVRQPELLDQVMKRFLKFIEDCRKSYDVICIDCNPSSSFITLCALRACTDLLVPVRLDRYSVLGLELLHGFVSTLDEIHQKPKFHVLLSDVPRLDRDQALEATLRSHDVFGPLTFASCVPHSRLLRASQDFTGFGTDRKVAHTKRLWVELAAVARELASKLGVA